MNKILTFSGWGQDAKSLCNISSECEYFDYMQYPSIDEASKKINGDYDLVIGWSLGGQIALQAILDGLITAQKLVLIATPFCFIKNNENPYGMDEKIYLNFKNNLEQDADKTLKKFATLMALGDLKKSDILNNLKNYNYNNLLYWLQTLANNSFEKSALQNLPHTIIIHGKNDKVVDYRQTTVWSDSLKKSVTHIIEDCGHCPHLHDFNKVRDLIL